MPIFDEGDLSNDVNSPSICSNFRSISQKEEQRDFDDSAKNKNREIETERGVKRKDKIDSDELTEETNGTPIQMFSYFEAKQRLQPQDWERFELKYWGKHRLPYISDVNRKAFGPYWVKLRDLLKNTSRLPTKLGVCH